MAIGVMMTIIYSSYSHLLAVTLVRVQSPLSRLLLSLSVVARSAATMMMMMQLNGGQPCNGAI